MPVELQQPRGVVTAGPEGTPHSGEAGAKRRGSVRLFTPPQTSFEASRVL